MGTDSPSNWSRALWVKGTTLLQCERGDVLMEYVLLTVLIVIPLIGGSSILFDPAGGEPMFSDFNQQRSGDFGLLGNSFVQLYRMIMSGVSLPLP